MRGLSWEGLVADVERRYAEGSLHDEEGDVLAATYPWLAYTVHLDMGSFDYVDMVDGPASAPGDVLPPRVGIDAVIQMVHARWESTEG